MEKEDKKGYNWNNRKYNEAKIKVDDRFWKD